MLVKKHLNSKRNMFQAGEGAVNITVKNFFQHKSSCFHDLSNTNSHFSRESEILNRQLY